MRKVTSKKPRRAIKKKPVLAVVEPLTFRVQAALLTAAKQSNFPLSLLDPNGFEIVDMAVNVLDIGMTTKETPAQKRRMGFVNMRETTPTRDNRIGSDEDRPVFEPEAILHINPGNEWVMEVMTAVDLGKYTGVAAAVMKMFSVNVTVIPFTQNIG